jgi:hypothetical protein
MTKTMTTRERIVCAMFWWTAFVFTIAFWGGTIHAAWRLSQ